jgi:hypothetical protein
MGLSQAAALHHLQPYSSLFGAYLGLTMPKQYWTTAEAAEYCITVASSNMSYPTGMGLLRQLAMVA